MTDGERISYPECVLASIKGGCKLKFSPIDFIISKNNNIILIYTEHSVDFNATRIDQNYAFHCIRFYIGQNV